MVQKHLHHHLMRRPGILIGHSLPWDSWKSFPFWCRRSKRRQGLTPGSGQRNTPLLAYVTPLGLALPLNTGHPTQCHSPPQSPHSVWARAGHKFLTELAHAFLLGLMTHTEAYRELEGGDVPIKQNP